MINLEFFKRIRGVSKRMAKNYDDRIIVIHRKQFDKLVILSEIGDIESGTQGLKHILKHVRKHNPKYEW
jgi:hypothetical protein